MGPGGGAQSSSEEMGADGGNLESEENYQQVDGGDHEHQAGAGKQQQRAKFCAADGGGEWSVNGEQNDKRGGQPAAGWRRKENTSR